MTNHKLVQSLQQKRVIVKMEKSKVGKYRRKSKETQSVEIKIVDLNIIFTISERVPFIKQRKNITHVMILTPATLSSRIFGWMNGWMSFVVMSSITGISPES